MKSLKIWETLIETSVLGDEDTVPHTRQILAWTPRGPAAGPAQRRRGPGLSPLPGPRRGVGGSPSCPVCPLLSGRPGQSARRRRRKCFPSSIGKNNSGARADREEGAPALLSLRPASSVSASPAGSEPDTPPAPSTALVTGTESSGTAQHPSLGPPAAPPRGSARLTPPGTKPDGWVFSAPLYRWEP